MKRKREPPDPRETHERTAATEKPEEETVPDEDRKREELGRGPIER